MDISTSCATCIHKPVCFIRRDLNAFNQNLWKNTTVFDNNRDMEDASEGMESILAANCRFFKRIKSKYA